MTGIDDAKLRSLLIAEKLGERADEDQRRQITEFQGRLDFEPGAGLMISKSAFNHVNSAGIDPRFVFAHPDLLAAHPAASIYYRGIALLSRKRVAALASSVDRWESGEAASAPQSKALEIARLYNTIISSIIEGSGQWALDDGYRNIVANMGIGLDGTVRNVVGRNAELFVKTRIRLWLDKRQMIISHDGQRRFLLPQNYVMLYRSEPDIEFLQTRMGQTSTVATIEIKGGKDPAGALERLGAIQKSFENTPPTCKNLLILGVMTEEMRTRLSNMNIEKIFMLDDLANDGEAWTDFINELFHHIIRITFARITDAV